ncbi:MAG TPA: phospho-sugar mutase, partial [Actinotalea sp.]|nr:phospho-sugar mutase [Actinotalea sp.]
LSARFADLGLIPATMARVREAPPATLAGSPVVEVTDLASPEPGTGLPPTDGLRLLSADGTRVVVRPSGTEPKVKCYLEVVVPVEEHAAHESVGQARRAARSRLEAVRADLTAALGL